MPLRIWVIGTRTSSAPAGNVIPALVEAAVAGADLAALGAAAVAMAGAVPVRWASTTAMTSSRVIRPPPPVPLTCEGSRPCSRSSRRTAGVMRALGSWSAAIDGAAVAAAWSAGAADGAGAAAGAATAATGSATGRSSEPAGPCAGSAAGVAAAGVAAGASVPPDSASSSVSMTAISALLGTVSPSWARISLRTPANGDGTSALTLSVMTSSSGSYLATESPGCLSQRPIVPSATLSPSWGIVTLATGSVPPMGHCEQAPSLAP